MRSDRRWRSLLGMVGLLVCLGVGEEGAYAQVDAGGRERTARDRMGADRPGSRHADLEKLRNACR